MKNLFLLTSLFSISSTASAFDLICHEGPADPGTCEVSIDVVLRSNGDYEYTYTRPCEGIHETISGTYSVDSAEAVFPKLVFYRSVNGQSEKFTEAQFLKRWNLLMLRWETLNCKTPESESTAVRGPASSAASASSQP